MKPNWPHSRLTALFLSVGWLSGFGTLPTWGAETPDILSIGLLNGRPVVDFSPAPAAVEYRLLQSPSPTETFSPDTGEVLSGFRLTGGLLGDDNRFFRVESVPLSAEALAATTLLHRIAYGPTPDELDRVRRLGPAAYLEEQLAPEKISETLDIGDAGQRGVGGGRRR